jgi:hypothetical protein
MRVQQRNIMPNNNVVIVYKKWSGPAPGEAHLIWNDRRVDWNKIRFGDRQSYAFFSIYNSKNGPELTAICQGITEAQRAVFNRVKDAAVKALASGEDYAFGDTFEVVGLAPTGISENDKKRMGPRSRGNR